MARSVLNKKQESTSNNWCFLNTLQKTRLSAACVAVLCYLNSICGEFVFDDHEAIVTNPDLRPSTPLTSVFLNDFWGAPMKSNLSHKSYRPITIITFRWNFFLGGLNPLGYHIANIILHSLTTLLFFQLSLKIFHGSLFQSGLSAIVFAVHPIHTEAVTNTVGRADVLCGFFYLLTILSYTKCFPGYSLHGIDKPLSKPTRYSRLWLCVTLMFSVISLLSKEQGLTALAVCVLYDVSYVCKISIANLHQLRDRAKAQRPLPRWIYSLSKRIVALVIFCIVLLFVRISFLGGSTPTFTESDNPTSFHPDKWTRIRTYLYIISLNCWLLLCPSTLCYDWSMDSIPRLESCSDIRNLLTFSVVVILWILVLYGLNQESRSSSPSKFERTGNNNKGHPLTSNGCVYDNFNFTKLQSSNSEVNEKFCQKLPCGDIASSNLDRQTVVLAVGMIVLPFLPASNLFFSVGFVLAERLLYIPSMGYCVLVALGISRLFHNNQQLSDWRKDSQVQISSSKWTYNPLWCGLTTPGKFFIPSLLLVLSFKTVYRNTEWFNTQTLAAAGLKVNAGNAKIHLTMANALAQKGQLACEAFYREAIRLRPQYASAWTNLGVVLLNTARASEAEEAYIKALTIRPASGDASTNYAHLLRIQGRYEEASHQYRRALVIRPSNPELLHFHAVVLEKLGKIKEAEEKYQNACSRTQDDPRPCAALGKMLAAPLINSEERSQSKINKQMKKAEMYLRKSLSMMADDCETLLLLGKLYWQTGKLHQADTELRHLLTRHPNSVEAEYTLGRVLESKAIHGEAKRLYRQVLKKDHTHNGARMALERLLNNKSERKFVDTKFTANLSSNTRS